MVSNGRRVIHMLCGHDTGDTATVLVVSFPAPTSSSRSQEPTGNAPIMVISNSGARNITI
jgi:hypothetical protein